MNTSKKISSGVISLTILKALNIIIPLVSTPYVSRVLGAEKVGIYSFTNSFASYLAMLAALGTMAYGSREISRSRDDIYLRSKTFWEIEIVTIVTTIISLLVWIICVLNVEEYRSFYLILSINIFAVLFDITWLFYGLEEYSFLVIRMLAVKVAGVVLIFLLVRNATDLIIYFAIMVAMQLFGNGVAWFGISKFIVRVPFRELRFVHHIKETMVYFIPSVATSVYNILDKSLLGVIRNDRYENGCYEQAETIINLIKGVSYSAMNVVIGVRNSYLHKNNEIDIIKQNIEKSLNYVFATACGFAFGIVAVCHELVEVYLGTGYELVKPLLVIFSPIILLIGVSDCLGAQYYIPVGKRRISARFIVFGAITNVVLNLIMIPKLGAIGAAFATVIAELLITCLYVLYASEYCPLSMLAKCSYKKMIAGLIMYSVIMMDSGIILEQGYSLILKTFVGILIYIVILVVLKDDFIDLILRKKKNNNVN